MKRSCKVKIHPVVHINSSERHAQRFAVDQSNRALDAGADGVFLIDHQSKNSFLTFDTLYNVRERNPDAYVGINLLGQTAIEALDDINHAMAWGWSDRAPNALWVDDVLRSGGTGPGSTLEVMHEQDDLRAMRLFGGIAFKYTQSYTDDPREAALQTEWLSPYVDVVTTSGKGTGHAPSPQKLAAMRAATTKPIAVASGISADNVADYAGNVDEVLIASSIETEPYSGIFDETELKRAIKAIHAA